jgi:hypothetical protein
MVSPHGTADFSGRYESKARKALPIGVLLPYQQKPQPPLTEAGKSKEMKVLAPANALTAKKAKPHGI